jgi:hypothetical protein
MGLPTYPASADHLSASERRLVSMALNHLPTPNAKAHLASVREHERAVLLVEVLIEAKPGRRVRLQHFRDRTDRHRRLEQVDRLLEFLQRLQRADVRSRAATALMGDRMLAHPPHRRYVALARAVRCRTSPVRVRASRFCCDARP